MSDSPNRFYESTVRLLTVIKRIVPVLSEFGGVGTVNQSLNIWLFDNVIVKIRKPDNWRIIVSDIVYLGNALNSQSLIGLIRQRIDELVHRCEIHPRINYNRR